MCLIRVHLALLAWVRYTAEVLFMCLTWLHLLGRLQCSLKRIALHL